MSNSKKASEGGLGNTRIQAPKEIRSRFFTLNNWTEGEKGAIIDWLNSRKGMSYMIQAEIGENGTPHLQGCWKSKTSIKTDWLKKEFPRVHWEPVKRWNDSVKYCSKLDTRDDGPWCSKDLEKFIEKDPVQGIRNPLAGKTLYEWQEFVLYWLDTEPDDRTIWWFWEPTGNCGKSALVKYIWLKYWGQVVIATGKGNDVRNQVCRHVNGVPKEEIEGKPLDIALLDFSRSIEDYVSYETIEQLKNGLLYSGKYEGGVCGFNPPHVMCFANFEPEVDKLSADRWQVINISEFMEPAWCRPSSDVDSSDESDSCESVSDE